MTDVIRGLWAACISLFLAGAASAATVNYVEADNGDLSDDYLSSTALTLDMAGVNTISGTATATVTGTDVFFIDGDYATLHLGAGVTVTSVTLAIDPFSEDVTGDAFSLVAFFQLIEDTTFSILDNATFDPTTGLYGSNDGDFGGPYASDLILQVDFQGGFGPDNVGASEVGYNWTIITTGPDASPIPLPASLPLIALGLGILGLLGRASPRKSEGA